MDSLKISNIMSLLGEKVDVVSFGLIKDKLEKIDDKNYDTLIFSINNLKSPTTMLIVSFFLGNFGVDRFLLGKVGSGIVKLLFGWLTFGIWWLIDVINARKNTQKYNGAKFQQAIALL